VNEDFNFDKITKNFNDLLRIFPCNKKQIPISTFVYAAPGYSTVCRNVEQVLRIYTVKFNSKNPTFCPCNAFMCSIKSLRIKCVFSLHNCARLLFLTEAHRVFFEVGTEYVYTS